MPGGARQEFNVGALKGIVYAVGAFGTAADSKRLEAYDPATNAWTTKASIPFSSNHPNVAATADKLYILGEVGAQNSAEYDPGANTWTMKAPVPTQARHRPPPRSGRRSTSRAARWDRTAPASGRRCATSPPTTP